MEAARDNRNNVEAVFLSPDPEGDGTDAPHDGDNQVRPGRWQLRVSHNATGPDQQRFAVIVAGGIRHVELETASWDTVGKNRFEWPPAEVSARYDVATKQDVSAQAPANSWLGPGGIFDVFSCRATNVGCTDSDGDNRCEYLTTTDGKPPAGFFDLWLVRVHTGSWGEAGSTALAGPPPVTRDTRMIDDGTSVCP